MLKTYRRDPDGTLSHREAWTESDGITVHSGTLGTKGTTNQLAARSRTCPTNPTHIELMSAFAERAVADGFAEIPVEDHGWVVLQVWMFTHDLSNPNDAWIFDHGQEQLDDRLGWVGVGHCDGNDIGGQAPRGRVARARGAFPRPAAGSSVEKTDTLGPLA